MMQSSSRIAAGLCPPATMRAQGIALFDKRDLQGALELLDRYLDQFPQDLGILNYKARALAGLGRLENALSCIDRALEVRPSDVAELCNRAALLTCLTRREEALATLDQVLDLAPDHVSTLIKRAVLLFQLGRPAEALASAERAVHSDPCDLSALNTRGMILDDLGRRAEARVDFERILSINPHYSDAITNCGVLCGRGGEFREALVYYDRSLSIKSEQPNAVYNRAVVRLVLGDWARGFAEFESRWQLFPHEASRLSRLAPRWNGEANLTGKTILLHHEQGYGDTLQFARYAPLVMTTGARVILAVPTALRRLMSTLPGSPDIVSEGERTPAHDFHCPLMSLPLLFGTTPDSVPAPIPYLRTDPSDVARWNKRLGERRRPRIGLAWCGRRFPPINHARDMTLGTMRPLFALNADFICLQTDLSEAERAELRTLPNGAVLEGTFADFADTAALVENLDLVITVDTAIAHLAGALGKPVWVMNRYASCWRWLLDRSDSPWYPALRLFRQPSLGDWDTAVRDVLLAGAAFILDQSPAKRRSSIAAETAEAPDLASLLQAALDHHNGGRLTAAVAAYRSILKIFPNQFDALHYLGVALAQLKRFHDALAPLTHAASLRPTDAVVHNHLGNALAGLGRHAEAIRSYERAITCDGGLADGFYNRGVALMALGQPEAAVACHTEASRLNPEHAQAYNNRGVVLAEFGQLNDALADYDRAVHIRPDFVDAWVNRSDVLRRLRQFDDALQSSWRALELEPERGAAHNGRGAILADLGRDEEALASYDRALDINPTSEEARWNKGLIELSRGNFLEGWKCYESRWGVKSLKLTKRFKNLAPWNGRSPVAGKVVLVHAEQGYGDTIQFSRYGSLVAAFGARVILCVPDVLRTLLRSLKGPETVLPQRSTPPFDYHCPLLSLPLALGTELHSVPATRRYLEADAAGKARWEARLEPNSRLPKIGLVWSGKPSHQKDQERSIPFRTLTPLLKHPARWVSLQKDVRASDESELSSTTGILRLGEELTNFADTAALIECLDLIIAVDSAVAHLAGALGKPVWILLPHVADWRWMQEREDSPWYPSARLFRQKTWGDWDPVIDRVGRELAHYARARPSNEVVE